jgi:hypothetical protein
MNEIPPGQRQFKASQIQRLAEDERFASVVVSCREKDFTVDFGLPFDTLTLQPLTPIQIRAFLHRVFSRQYGAEDGPAKAEAHFWQIAGGEDVRQVWEAWEKAGVTFELFWSAAHIPYENLNMDFLTFWEQQNIWRRARFDPRGLIRLAANPYLLTIMMQLRTIPRNRARLFAGFLKVLFEREREARAKRHDAARIPERKSWEAALVELAETLQRNSSVGSSLLGEARFSHLIY